MCCHGSLDIDTPIRNRVASYLYSILPWAVYTAWCQHKATQRKLKESNFTTFKHASMMIWVNLIYQSIIDFQGDCTHQVKLLTEVLRSHVNMPCFKSHLCFQSSFRLVLRYLSSCHPIEFLASHFSLAQLQLLWAFGEWNSSRWT